VTDAQSVGDVPRAGPSPLAERPVLAEPSTDGAATSPTEVPPGSGWQPPWDADHGREPAQPGGFTPRRVAISILVWAVLTVVVVGLILYGVGPMLQQRDQRGLLDDYRRQITEAANAADSFSEPEIVTTAPDIGNPVAIIEIPRIEVQQVVIEGVGPQQTRRGPGHVPGTAGPGQPGNSAIVGRRAAFGGSFAELGRLRTGDEILVTTTQGPSVYVVADVRGADVAAGSGSTPATTTTASTTTTTTASTTTSTATSTTAASDSSAGDADAERLLPDGSLSTDELYGASPDDRLTLVTSASRRPWATGRATIVVAELEGRPYEPTPQNGRTVEADGRGRDSSAWAPLAIAAAAYAIAAVTALLIYRRARPLSAYLLTAPPLLAATFLTAETAARLLPAWL
jgi:sortase A